MKGSGIMEKELIYDLMIGVIEKKEAEAPDIPDEFEKEPCDRLYSEIYELKNKINERLRSEDDPDVTHLTDCCSELTKYLCMKMFEYGTKYGK